MIGILYVNRFIEMGIKGRLCLVMNPRERERVLTVLIEKPSLLYITFLQYDYGQDKEPSGKHIQSDPVIKVPLGPTDLVSYTEEPLH